MGAKFSSLDEQPHTPIGDLATEYRLTLRSERKSPKTITVYMSALDILAAFLAARGHSLDVESITRMDMLEFMSDQLDRYKPATASNRFRALKTFFRWAVAEDVIPSSPMDRMKAPTIPASPPAVLTGEEFKSILDQCSGRAFEDVRDTAIILMFFVTGCRRAEIAGLTVDDVDVEAGTAVVTGKGSLVRVVRFNPETAKALARYIRTRKQHRDRDKAALWLGHAGPMTDSGVYQVVRDRAAAAGLKIHPHQFRHTYAHRWLADGGNEGDLMRLTGWKSRDMVSRYGASAADERAHDAYDRHDPMKGL